MLIEDDTGYVLHARSYRETSLLVEVLSAQHGRLGLLARGVASAKGQVLRAALQPLQWVRFSALQRGELAQLRSAEALDAAPRLFGDGMLAGFYLGELTLRLAPRLDPLPELYLAYGEARARLAVGAGLAWTLRRYERELLTAVGLGFELDVAVDGTPIDPAARYVLEPMEGPRRLFSERSIDERRRSATGAALIALAADEEPTAADLASLRLPMRTVLAHHLGARGLKSWELLDDLGRRR